MVDNRVASLPETIIRFFSFFTILTNLMVAIYLTLIFIKRNSTTQTSISKPGTLTAITVYITIVGLVYQVILRPIWDPQGFQMVVDELLHTIVPIFMLLFWWKFETKAVRWNQFFSWLLYPLVYLIYVLIRGGFSGFYPYPFIHVAEIGIEQVLINSLFLVGLFVLMSLLFLGIGKLKNGRSFES